MTKEQLHLKNEAMFKNTTSNQVCVNYINDMGVSGTLFKTKEQITECIDREDVKTSFTDGIFLFDWRK
jgi:hypothetical protein